MLLPVVLAVGGVIALTALGMKRSLDPAVKAGAERARLAKLKSRPASSLSLDEAEDGLVLARRYKDAAAEIYFAKLKEALRTRRVPI